MGKRNNDIVVMTEFNKVIQDNANSQKAFKIALKNTELSLKDVSSRAVELMKTSKDGAINIEQYNASLEKMTATSIASSIAVKAFSFAINAGISLLIAGALTWINDQIHAQEKLESKLSDLKTEYDESNQKISELNNELQNTKDLIREINANGISSIIDKERLDELKDAEQSLLRQIELEKKLNEIRYRDAQQTALDVIQGKYSSVYQSHNPIAQALHVSGTIDASYENYIHTQIDNLNALKKLEQNAWSDFYTSDNESEIVQESLLEKATLASDRTIKALEVISEARQYLKDQFGTLSRIENPTEAWMVEFNKYFDLISYYENAIINADSGKRAAQYDKIKRDFSKSLLVIQNYIEQNGKIDFSQLEIIAPDIKKAFVEYGWNADDITQLLNNEYASIISYSNSELLNKSYDAIITSVEKTQPVVEALTAALEEQASAGSITAETYKKLIAQDANFANFLEKTASGYMLNTDAAYDYLEAQNQFTKGKAIGRIMELQEALANPDLTDDAIKAYQSEITQLELLVTELDSATDAYARLTNARDTANQDAGYQNVKSGYDQFAADRKRGKTNTDDFQAQVDYLLGEDWRSRIGTKGGYKNEKAAYQAAEKLFKRYYNYSEKNELNGALKFVEDLTKTDLYDKKNDTIVASTIEEIAAVMQTSTANVRNLLGLLDTYGMAPELTFSIDESDKALAEKTAEIEKAQQKITEIYAEIDRLEQEMNTLRENGDEASAADRQQQLDQLNAELQTYQAVINAGLSDSGSNTLLKDTLADLNEVHNVLKTLEESGLNIDIILGGDWNYLKSFLMDDFELPSVHDVPLDEPQQKAKQSVPPAKNYHRTEPNISFADDVIAESITIPAIVDEETLIESAQEVVDSIKQDIPVKLEATAESIDGGEVSFDINQTTIDDWNRIAKNTMRLAEFKGFGDTFNASNLQVATEELNNAWNELQEIEDTSSADFQSVSDRLGVAVTNFVNAKTSLDSVMSIGQSVDIKADITDAQKAINSLDDQILTVKVRTVQTGSGFASGTRKAMGGTSLVDEEGAELILHKNQGTYELGTNQGARMTQLEPGDEVIPASETKKILRRAAKSGGAFATGTSAWKNISQLLSSGNNSSSSSSKTKKLSSSSYKKYIEKLFDWIEIRLEALQRVTDGWMQSATEAVGYIAKNASLDKALANITKQMNDSAKAYSQYMTQADTIAKKAGLSADIVKKVQEGSIEIASYDSKTQDKIKSYQEWYNKALDVKDAIVELREQEKELAAEKLDNVLNHYQWRIDRIDSALDYNSALIDLKGSSGVQITQSDYADSIDATIKKIEELKTERSVLEKEFKAMVEAGYITEGSEQWYEYQSELDNLDVTILETSSDLQELIDSSNNVTLTNLQYALAALERSAAEVSNVMDLHEAQGVDHSGSDYESLIQNGMEQIRNFKAQNDELRRQQEGLDELSEKYQELQDQINDNNDAINDMMISQEQWNDAVLDLRINEIQKYKDELAKVNDQYERQQALQHAIEDLERAKAQRNKKIYREGVGLVWEEDRDAIQDAQEKLDQLIHQETMNKLDELIEAVENQKLDSNVYSANGTLLGKEYSLPSFVGYAELMNSLGGTNIVSSAMDQAKKAAYQQTIGSVVSSAPATTLTIGDINVHGVDSPDALAEALLAEFPNAMLRAMYKK